VTANRVLLVVRSGEKPFPAAAVPGLEVVDRATHAIETLYPAAEGVEGRFDFVIVTSRAAVDRLAARDDLRSRLSGRMLAVGPTTADRMRSALSAKVEEGGGSSRAILEKLPRDLAGARVLLPQGDDADEELPRELERRGAEVVRLTLYRKAALPYDSDLDERIREGDLAVFCATSPAAARWLFDGAAADAVVRLRRTPAVALGARTREELDTRGVERTEVARPPTFETAARLAVRLAGLRPPA
jgi:uroporphyrinogen-III synthase